VLVAEDVCDPLPGPGQVAIDVDVANLTFVETQVRAGRPPHPSMLPPLPAILGNGVGGVVAAVGHGVDSGLVGRRVVTSLRGTGGYAERAVADSSGLIEIQDQLRMQQAVALLADGRTAMMLARAAAIRPGETVLVEAAAGGVGSLLVQLAHSAGWWTIHTRTGRTDCAPAWAEWTSSSTAWAEPSGAQRSICCAAADDSAPSEWRVVLLWKSRMSWYRRAGSR